MTNQIPPINSGLYRSLIEGGPGAYSHPVPEGWSGAAPAPDPKADGNTADSWGDQIWKRSFIPVDVAEKTLSDKVQNRLDRLSRQSEQQTQLPSD